MSSPVKSGRHPGIYIGLYCSTTITLLFFNKWLFTQVPDFKFVLTITWIQQLGVALIIYLLRPLMAPLVGHVGLSWTLFRRIAPVGGIAAIDHAFSNLALQALPMTIYEIVKSCAPAVVLSLSIFLGLTQPSIKLTIVVIMIVSGAIIGVYRPSGSGHSDGPSAITAIGLFYICMAALSAATKSVAAQITLQGNKSKLPKKRTRSNSNTRASQLVALGGSASNSCNPSVVGTPIEGRADIDDKFASSERDSLNPSRETSFYGGTASTAAPSPNHSNVGTSSSVTGLTTHRTRTSRVRSSSRHARTGSTSASLGACPYEGMTGEERKLYDLYGPTNPATVACVSSAVTVLTVLPFAMLREYEGLAVWAGNASVLGSLRLIGLIFLGSTLSVVANICSLFVMREASALTYALVAVCQRGLTVVAAVLFLHEELPPWAVGGFSLTMCGIIFYNRMSTHGHHQHEAQHHQQEKEREKVAETETSAHRMTAISDSSIKVSSSMNTSEAMEASGVRLGGRERGSKRRLGGGSRHGSALKVSFSSLPQSGDSFASSEGEDSCCSRDRRERKVRHTMAAVSGDAMFLAALESHSDSSSSDESSGDEFETYSKSSSDAEDEELKARVRFAVLE